MIETGLNQRIFESVFMQELESSVGFSQPVSPSVCLHQQVGEMQQERWLVCGVVSDEAGKIAEV